MRSAVVAVALAALWPGPARADDVFTVTGVPVDVTADTAAAAREQALLEGQRKAVQILLRRLTLKQDAGSLPVLSDSQLLEVVQGIEVEREKISAVRYLGDITVRFKPDAIRNLLRGAGIRYAETVSKPLVVVPVYRTGDTLLLWDDDNPWRSAWAEHVTKDGLVPLIVPLGDLTDMAAVTADDAVQGNVAKLAAFARRYGATDTLVVVASPSPDGSAVDIAATRYGSTQQERTDVLRVAGEPGDTTDALLARAVAEVQSQVEEGWKQENILRFGEEQTLSVTVPLRDLSEWVSVRRKLGEIAYIRSTEIVSLSKSQAVVGLHYIGDVGQLQLALSQKDLDLTQEAATWTLRPAAPPPAPAPAPTAVGAPEGGTAAQPPPETTAPGTTPPETTAPETAAPVSAAPGPTAPETTAPETAAPLSAAPASTAPETTAPSSAARSAPEGPPATPAGQTPASEETRPGAGGDAAPAGEGAPGAGNATKW